MRRAGWRLFALAFGLRLAWAWAGGQLTAGFKDPLYDDGAYWDMALSFIGRSPRLWVTHPPGFSIALIPFAALGGSGLLLARWAQLALGAALAPMTFRFSRFLGFSEDSSRAAGLLAAVHPMLVYFSARLMTEIPFAFLVVCFFWAWLAAWSAGSPRLAALAGVAGGLASLTRGVMLPYGGVLALVACLMRAEQPRWISLVAVCGLAWAGTVSAWTARNWVRFHRFVPVSVQGGWNLYEGLTLDLREIERERPLRMSRESQEMGLTDTFEIDDYFSRKAKEWISENPGKFLRLTFRKALKFWRPFPYPPHPAAGRLATGFFVLALYALAALGLLRGAGSRPGFPFLLGWAITLTVLHAVFASNLRYRLPLEPFLAVYAGAGLASLWRGAKSSTIAGHKGTPP